MEIWIYIFFYFLSYSGFRLHDFHIGVTTVSPEVETPVVNNYPLCHVFNGIAGAQTSITCSQCNWGRYVIVQIPGNEEVLTLCEVKVFGIISKDQV